MQTAEQRQRRNAAILADLRKGDRVPDLMHRYGLSRASVHRIGRDAFAAESPAGQPPARSAAQINLFAERGRSGLRRFGGSIDDDYDRVFRSLRSRMALYREMGDDPIVAAVLQAIKMTLRRVSWYAETDGETAADKAAAEWLETCMHDMSQSWTDTIDQALGMLQYGFYPAELVYKPRRGDREQTITVDGVSVTLPPSKYDDGKIGWRKWVFLAPETLAPGSEWVFDDYGGLVGLNQQAPPDYQTFFIPIEKIVNFRTTAERGNPEGRSILRAMYKPWYFKSNLEEVEAISAERFGTGFPVAYLGNDTSRSTDDAAGDLATFMDIVRNVRVDEQSGLVIPYAKMGAGAKEGEGALFEFVTPPGSGPVKFHDVIARDEQRMAMVGLAQFIHLGMNGEGARALGESSQDFFTLAVSAWADGVADTIQRYAVDRLFKLNSFPGLTTVPRIAHEAVAQTDLKSVASYINTLAGQQLITPTEDLERYLLELADLPVGQRIHEIWEAKEKARETALNAAAEAPVVAPNAEAEKPPVGQPKDDDEDDDVKNKELAAELRRANDLLQASLDAERFAARQSAPQPVTVHIDNRPEKLVVENQTVNAPAPDMTSVADAIRANGQQQAEQMAAQVAQSEKLSAAQAAANDRPIVVNVPEQPAPVVTVNVPPTVVNVAPAAVTVPPAIVSVDMAPVAAALREVGQTEETLTIERDDKTGLMKSATKRRRKKG